MDKVSIACLFNLLHSTVWPDECTIATEDEKEDHEEGEEAARGANQQDEQVNVDHNQSHTSALDLFDKYAWLLDLLSIDHHSILPFLMEKFSSKDANVTLIYNLINVFFARLTLDCSSSSQVS